MKCHMVGVVVFMISVGEHLSNVFTYPFNTGLQLPFQQSSQEVPSRLRVDCVVFNCFFKI